MVRSMNFVMHSKLRDKTHAFPHFYVSLFCPHYDFFLLRQGSCNPCCHGTHYIDQDALKLRDCSNPCLLSDGLKACTIMPGTAMNLWKLNKRNVFMTAFPRGWRYHLGLAALSEDSGFNSQKTAAHNCLELQLQGIDGPLASTCT